jgi:hypothetical protein
MATDDTKPVKKKLGWNPFQKLDGEAWALIAAKFGAIVGGYLILSYVIQVALLYGRGRDMFGNVGMTLLVIDAIAIVIAVFITWRIFVRQPLWASIMIAAWFALELTMTIAAIASGTQTTNFGYVVMFVALAAAAILSIRGSWKLRVLRSTRPAV